LKQSIEKLEFYERNGEIALTECENNSGDVSPEQYIWDHKKWIDDVRDYLGTDPIIHLNPIWKKWYGNSADGYENRDKWEKRSPTPPNACSDYSDIQRRLECIQFYLSVMKKEDKKEEQIAEEADEKLNNKKVKFNLIRIGVLIFAFIAFAIFRLVNSNWRRTIQSLSIVQMPRHAHWADVSENSNHRIQLMGCLIVTNNMIGTDIRILRAIIKNTDIEAFVTVSYLDRNEALPPNENPISPNNSIIVNLMFFEEVRSVPSNRRIKRDIVLIDQNGNIHEIKKVLFTRVA